MRGLNCGGWLDTLGVGTTRGGRRVFHGGWAALAGVLIIGAPGKFGTDGSVLAPPPSNVPAVMLGVFIIWLGFLGFNAGSRPDAALRFGDAVPAVVHDPGSHE